MATPTLASAEAGKLVASKLGPSMMSRQPPSAGSSPGSGSLVRQMIAGMMVSVGGRQNPDLTQRTMLVLLKLYESGKPDTVTEMAGLLRLPKSAVTRSMDRLVGYGWARRVKHPTDLRVVKLQIAPQGMKHVRQIEAAMRDAAMRA